MKSVLLITAGLVLLLAGSQAADAQGQTRGTRTRTGNFGTGTGFGYGPGGYGTADPRTVTVWTNSPYGTNGFDLIAINNIFNPTRVYTPPRVAGPPPIPSYNFTVNGILTDGGHGMGYVFFYGNSVANKGYTNSETINGFKISDIANNTVTLVDTNNKTFTLQVGSGFSKLGTNDWRYLPVPDAASYVPSATSSSVDAGAGDDSLPAGPVSDAMRRMIERRKAEMGETQGPAAGDATAPAPAGDAPPAPPQGDAPPAPPAPPAP